MFAIFQFAFNAVAPIICLILIGSVAVRLGFVDVPSLKKINKFNFHFCFASLMITNLYAVEDLSDLPLGMFGSLLVILGILTFVGWLVAHFATQRRDRKAVLMQSAFRSNYAIIGLMLAEALGGAEGRTLATLCQLPCVVFFNVGAVVCFSVYADDSDGVNVGKVLKGIAKNPLIIGILTGTLILILRGFIPVNAAGEKVFLIQRDLPWLYQTVSYLSRLATPIALIVLGGQLEFKEISGFKKELIAGVSTRLILTPVIGLGLSYLAASLGLFTINPGALAVLIAVFGSPLAVATSVMAMEMHADDSFAGQVVVWTTVLSMVTLFLIVLLFRAAGQL